MLPSKFRRLTFNISLLSILVGLLPALVMAKPPPAWDVYLGTYTGPKSQGIYLYSLDTKTGTLTPKGLAGQSDQPSFLANHPDNEVVYAGNESGKGGISAFSVEPRSGKLNFLNQQLWPAGGPCHISIDPSGKFVFGASYGSGTIASYKVLADGSLSEAVSTLGSKDPVLNPGQKNGERGHWIAADPAGKFVLAAYLGLDKIGVYKLNRKSGALELNDPPSGSTKAGAGPRHLSFHPKGRFVYVINETDSTLSVFSFDPKSGAMELLQTEPTLPASYKGKNSTAEIEVHPSGKFVYGSNRGHDSLVIFSIDPKSGGISLVGHQSILGKTPRGFAIDPSGEFLLAGGQDSGTIAVFRVDQATGRLEALGTPVEAPTPVSFIFRKPSKR